MKQFLLYSWYILIVLGCGRPSKTEPTPIWTEEDRNTLIKGLLSSQEKLLEVVNPLGESQWFFKPDNDKWSIAEIVEHLGVQQDMHYREVYVISKTPPNPEFVSRVKGNEIKILNYQSDTTQGSASWNVEPRGRWCEKEDAILQFQNTRTQFIKFVQNTNADLKQHFTFRSLPDKTDYRNVRDLHQIVLTTVTHTSRHIHQIEVQMMHPDFPM